MPLLYQKDEHDSHGYALTHVLQVEDNGTRPAPRYGHTPRQRAPQEEYFIKKKQKEGQKTRQYKCHARGNREYSGDT